MFFLFRLISNNYTERTLNLLSFQTSQYCFLKVYQRTYKVCGVSLFQKTFLLAFFSGLFEIVFHLICGFCVADSPGVPPSATAHELFRGFSYVASNVEDSTTKTNNTICSRVSGNNFNFMS